MQKGDCVVLVKGKELCESGSKGTVLDIIEDDGNLVVKCTNDPDGTTCNELLPPSPPSDFKPCE